MTLASPGGLVTQQRSHASGWIVLLSMSALVTTGVCLALTARGSARPVVAEKLTDVQRLIESDLGTINVVAIDSYAAVQLGHASALKRIEFTPDGRFLITQSDKGDVVLWDALTGQKIRDVLPSGQPDRFYSHFSGKHTLYGFADKTALLLTGRRSVDETGKAVAWLELQPLDETVRPSRRKPPRKYRLADPQPAYGVALPMFANLSHDGRYLVSQGHTGLQVWNVESTERIWDAWHKPNGEEETSLKLRKQFGGEPWWLGNSVNAVLRLAIYAAVRPDGQMLHWHGEMYVSGEGTDNRFSPDGKRYVTNDWTDTGSSDEDVVLWDVARREPIRKTSRPYADLQHLHFTLNGQFYLERADAPTNANLRRTSDAELVYIFAHSTNITARTLSPDGKTCLIATQDGYLHRWHIESGENLWSIYVGAHVISLAIRHDGQQCLIGTKDGIAVSLELPSGETAVRFENDATTGEPTNGQALYSPDGSRVVISSTGNTFRQASLWDARTGKRLQLLTSPPTHEVWLSPSGRWALSVPRNLSPSVLNYYQYQHRELFKTLPPQVKLRDPATGEVLHVFQNDTQSARAPSRKGPQRGRRQDFQLAWRIAGSIEPGYVEPTAALTSANIRPQRPQGFFEFLPSQRSIINDIPKLDDEGRDWLLGLVAKEPPRIKPNERRIRWMEEIGDGKYAPRAPSGNLFAGVIAEVVGDTDTDEVVSVKGERVEFAMTDAELANARHATDDKQAMSPTAAAITSDRSQVLVAYCTAQTGTTSVLALWDVQAKKRLKKIDVTVEAKHSNWSVKSLTFSPNNRYVAIGFEHHMYLLDLETDERLSLGELRGYSLRSNQEFARFSPDSRQLVCLDQEHSLWNIATRKKLAELKTDDSNEGPIFSPNGKFVICTSGRECHIWNAENGEKLTLQRNGYHGGLFQFSPDGTRFVGAKSGPDSGQSYSQLTLWDFQNGKELASLFEDTETGNRDEVRGAIFSPDGKLLVSTTRNKLSVWDAETGKLAGSQSAEGFEFDFQQNIQGPMFINNKQLVTIHQLGAVLWDLDDVMPTFSFPSPSSRQVAIRLLAGNSQLLVAAPQEDGAIWDIKTGKRLHIIPKLPGDLMTGFNQLRFSPNERQLFAFHRQGEAVTVWDSANDWKAVRYFLFDYGRKWQTESCSVY